MNSSLSLRCISCSHAKSTDIKFDNRVETMTRTELVETKFSGMCNTCLGAKIFKTGIVDVTKFVLHLLNSCHSFNPLVKLDSDMNEFRKIFEVQENGYKLKNCVLGLNSVTSVIPFLQTFCP